jgi:hypothetical protein
MRSKQNIVHISATAENLFYLSSGRCQCDIAFFYLNVVQISQTDDCSVINSTRQSLQWSAETEIRRKVMPVRYYMSLNDL